MKIGEKLILFKSTSKRKAVALQTLMEILGKQVPLNMLAKRRLYSKDLYKNNR